MIDELIGTVPSLERYWKDSARSVRSMIKDNEFQTLDLRSFSEMLLGISLLASTISDGFNSNPVSVELSSALDYLGDIPDNYRDADLEKIYTNASAAADIISRMV